MTRAERQQKKHDELFGGYKLPQKSSTTRRVHSKGNLWNHHSLPRIKSNIEILIG